MKTRTKLEGGLEPTLFIYSNLGIQRTRTNKKNTQREWRLLSMTWKEQMTFLGEAVIHILFEVEVRLFYFFLTLIPLEVMIMFLAIYAPRAS